jgi:hypothetical protein
MTYKDILVRVANNLVLPSLTSAFISVGKKDIYDVLCVLTQEHEFVTTEKTIPITSAATSVELPTSMPDFFSPLELIFLDTEGHQFTAKEVLPETFLKWNPNVETAVTSFSELVTNATPEAMLYTSENELLDGYVGYTFTDDFAPVLKWKPAINGSIRIIYVRQPILTDLGYGFNYGLNYGSNDLLGFTPPLNPSFHTMIVEAITLKMLLREYRREDMTEMQMLATRELYSKHEKELKKQSDIFAAFVKKTATFEAKEIEFPDFLNDRSMLL